MLARLSSQVSNEPLISNEQFAIGGVDTVRGYSESCALGDQGVAGTLELRTPPLTKYLTLQPGTLFGHVFLDSGHVIISDPLPAQTEKFTLSSVGWGMRLNGLRGVNSALELAWPLKDSGKVDKGDARLHFNVGFSW